MRSLKESNILKIRKLFKAKQETDIYICELRGTHVKSKAFLIVIHGKMWKSAL